MDGLTMIEALGAAAPPDGAEGDAMLFARFVGEWDVVVIYHLGGTKEIRRGEWLFGWILDGMAIQDVWRVPSRAESARSGAAVHGYGTTVRFYDPAIAAWRSTWHGLVKGEVIPFIGRSAGPEIHLEDRRADPVVRRWAFSAIAADAFHWRNELSSDGGATWLLEQEMDAVRREPER